MPWRCARSRAVLVLALASVSLGFASCKRRGFGDNASTLVHDGRPLAGNVPIGLVFFAKPTPDGGYTDAVPLCTATLLDERHLVTASHCFLRFQSESGAFAFPAKERLYVTFDDALREGVSVIPVDRVIHQIPTTSGSAAHRVWLWYTKATSVTGTTAVFAQVAASDLALIRLGTPALAGGKAVTPAQLCPVSSPLPGEQAQVAGYGVGSVVQIGEERATIIGTRLYRDFKAAGPHGNGGVAAGAVPARSGPDHADSGGFVGRIGSASKPYELCGVTLTSVEEFKMRPSSPALFLFLFRDLDPPARAWLEAAKVEALATNEIFIAKPASDLSEVLADLPMGASYPASASGAALLRIGESAAASTAEVYTQTSSLSLPGLVTNRFTVHVIARAKACREGACFLAFILGFPAKEKMEAFAKELREGLARNEFPSCFLRDSYEYAGEGPGYAVEAGEQVPLADRHYARFQPLARSTGAILPASLRLFPAKSACDQ